jgi:LAO/AO transport system kinase
VIDLLPKVREGNIRAIARVITLIENNDEAARTAVSFLYPYTGKAHVVGVTGPPGSGKSTLVSGLAKQFLNDGKRVGIIAVDPTSPFSGGAILGDRVRMQDLAAHKGIFIRSMASRGTLGGLARATSTAIKVLDAAGYETVLVETVGAGQAEIDIADTAHTTLVIEAPGMGDEVQSIKAGILEIADVLVVNKADQPGALKTVKILEMMLHMGQVIPARHYGALTGTVLAADDSKEEEWQVRVLQTEASTGAGVPALAQRVRDHYQFLVQGDGWLARERERSRKELALLLQERFMARLVGMISSADREAYVEDVALRKLDPYSAVDKLFAHIGKRIA